MPRPSDLYATLGAPGVYPSTTPLPNVFLVPPIEDDQDIYCLFDSNSVSSPYEPFYEDPTYTPPSPNMTNVFHQALSFFHYQPTGGTHSHQRSPWESGDHGIMSPSHVAYPPYDADPSLFRTTPTTSFPNVRFLIDQGAIRPAPQEEQNISRRPASRRSSVFGERPINYEAIQESGWEEGARVGWAKKVQGMSLRGRAAMALKAFKGTKHEPEQRPERPVARDVGDHPQYFYRLERGSLSTGKLQKHKRRKLFSSGSNVAARHTQLPLAPLASSGDLPHLAWSPPHAKLTKRKSLTQLFRLSRSSKPLDSHLHWESSVSLSPPPARGLFRHKSLPRLFSRESSSASPSFWDSTSNIGRNWPHPTAERLDARHTLEGPIIYDTDPSLSHSFTTSPFVGLHSDTGVHEYKPSKGRKPLTLSHHFSLPFLHRRRYSSPHPAFSGESQITPGLAPISAESSGSERANPVWEMTESSSSDPLSMDSEADDVDRTRLAAPQPDIQSLRFSALQPGEDGDVDFSSMGVEHKGDASQWFDDLESSYLDVESGEDDASLELPGRLNSPIFEQLALHADRLRGQAYAI